MRQRVVAVREALVLESTGADDGWLATRGGSAFGERNALLARLTDLGARVLEEPDDVVRAEVDRILTDVSQHLRRLDSTARGVETGGPE